MDTIYVTLSNARAVRTYLGAPEPMAVQYTWLSGGGTLTWPARNTAVNVDFTLPAGATLRRLQLHEMSIGGYQSGLTYQSVQPLAMHQQWIYNFTSTSARVLYTTTKALPMVASGFFATAVDVYNAWYSGGDNEMGHNQKTSYGGPTAFTIPLRFQWYVTGSDGFADDYHIRMDYTVKALYSVLA